MRQAIPNRDGFESSQTGDGFCQLGEMGFEMSYTSPLITTIDGVEQVVVLSNDRVAAVDPGKGEILWSFKPWRAKRNIPAPTPVGDGRFFVTSGYGIGAAMNRFNR